MPVMNPRPTIVIIAFGKTKPNSLKVSKDHGGRAGGNGYESGTTRKARLLRKNSPR
jgi:hypothetical protein